MRPFRQAGKDKNPTQELLRNVRRALGIQAAEIVRKTGVSRRQLYRLEKGEARNTVTMRSMARVAGAMGCKMVYGIVPADGKTLGELAEVRMWKKALGLEQGAGSREYGTGNREQGTGNREQGWAFGGGGDYFCCIFFGWTGRFLWGGR
jgi:transcriptional regulator with XRE-family HTH domain